jgi:SGNH domain (fused to AT3 domains)
VIGTVVQRLLVPEREMLIYQASFDQDTYRCGRLFRVLHPTAISCEITTPIAAPSRRVLLVGDSHADSIKATFAQAAQAANISVFFMVENRPLEPEGVVTPERLVAEAEARGSDAIVLHYSPQAIDYPIIERLAVLASRRSIRLSFIMPVPVWERPVPLMLLENLKGSQPLTTQGISDYEHANRRLIDGLAATNLSNLKVYPIFGVFCQTTCRLQSDSGKPLYFDRSHLTITGSKMLRPVFDELLTNRS